MADFNQRVAIRPGQDAIEATHFSSMAMGVGNRLISMAAGMVGRWIQYSADALNVLKSRFM